MRKAIYFANLVRVCLTIPKNSRLCTKSVRTSEQKQHEGFVRSCHNLMSKGLATVKKAEQNQGKLQIAFRKQLSLR